MLFRPHKEWQFQICKKLLQSGIRFFGNISHKLNNFQRQCIDNIPVTDMVYGQPTFKTHPHLLNEHELLPGIKADEFKERRDKYMELLCAETHSLYGMQKHHVIIIPSATKIYMTEKIPYVFRQNSDFLYFTGCLEPDTALILTGSSPDDYCSTFIARHQDKHSQLWDGPRTGVDAATALFCVDQALLVDGLPGFLLQIAEKHPGHIVYYDTENPIQPALHSIVKNHIQSHSPIVSNLMRSFAHKLRLIKSKSEQRLLEKSGQIASEAINKTISITHPGITEHQLFATVDYESRMNGAEILAYPPVVASGNNANIIHYIDNKQIVKDGDLILMDAGCELHGYCSDITRTWPANGKFSPYQKILYELLLDVQCEMIKLCAERLPLDSIYSKMIQMLGQRLKQEKIVKQDVNNPYKLNQVTLDICPHHVGHYLGMDVHDVATIGRNIALKPGMVLTIEPGIYIRRDMDCVAEEFRGVGMRIEDDVLITDTNYQVLSSRCPKTVQEIECLMQRSDNLITVCDKK